ncbi:MAG TPA: hypothetical protein VMZ71_02020 [Gemmataceae bacterium]|nr:hypothetical protein [Gemmataceae bacterium]
MATDKTLDTLKAQQAQAAAALARSDSIANQRKLRKAQQALLDYQASQKKKSKGSATPGPGYGLREYENPATQPRLAPIDRNNRDQVIWRQTELKNLGANIKVDGVWGPVTEWYEAMANNGDLNPETGGTAGRPSTDRALSGSMPAFDDPIPSRGAAPAVPTYTAPPRQSAASLSASDFRTRVLTEIPAYAAFLDIPDLVPIIQQRLDGAISPEEFGARVQQTTWYRTTPERTRAWMGLYATDPATAERKIDEQAAKVKAAAGAYYVPMADVTAREWAKKVLSGEVPETALDEYVKQQAKSLFPALAGAIDQGVTVEQYADPYKQIAAQTLELNPNGINFNDPRWSRALVQVGKDGQRGSMTLYDWQNLLKTDATYGWDRTNQARTQATQISERIAQQFGKVG